MSVFYMKQKVFSFKDKYKIFDAEGKQVYHCAGKVFSFTRKKELFDSVTNQHLYTLKRALFRLLPKYYLIDPKDNSTVATIQKKLALMKHKLEIDSGLGAYVIEGNLFAHDFGILENGGEIVSVHKKWVSFGDSYEITIKDEAKVPFFLGMVVLIDDCLFEKPRRHNF